jgi:hypothetical protein
VDKKRQKKINLLLLQLVVGMPSSNLLIFAALALTEIRE